ncbi:hypothetical protein [Micromonospora cremea]|uniref:Uncharacterized protein n=1 Tax=Micromonospora cremea TaxID=709881 RepID=A0A1N6BDH6_9ACTN|nr:hypothetical protein [Micromonospora cremea]SIN44381.1 hypothetical protein SAMN04489832_7238 [Micromonospora cremea]
MQDEQIGDLKIRRQRNGMTSLRWNSDTSEPPRRASFTDEVWLPDAARWFKGIGVLSLGLAVVAFVAGVRLLGSGDRLWGALALLPGLVLVCVAALFSVMVLAIGIARRGNVLHLDAEAAATFEEALTEARRQVGPEPTPEQRQPVAAHLWELALDLSDSDERVDRSDSA